MIQIIDEEEPRRVAETVAAMELEHAVITSVNRDELAAVDREGIREWRRWRLSLEELGDQSWS